MMERKNNSKIKGIYVLTMILIIILIFSGVAYAGIKIYEHIKERTSLVAITRNPIYEDTNTIWVGSFQLAWNELKDYVGGDIKFENYDSALADELNTTTFTRDMLSEKDYYIKTGLLTSALTKDIKKDLENKFGDTERFDLLRNLDYNADEWHYLIYSVISKDFDFLTPFDKLGKDSFKNSEEKFEYFGIDANSADVVDDNVEVLFYNSTSDFAVKLKTQNNEDVFLYRTENIGTFESLYTEMQQKNKAYKGSRFFDTADRLKIPYININTMISYDELCNKIIEGTDNLYIAEAIQNVKFKLDETGGSLDSEAALHLMNFSDPLDFKEFYFTDKFVMFLKESDKEQFYMALSVDNSEILKM